MGFELVKVVKRQTPDGGWTKHIFYDTGINGLIAFWDLHDNTIPDTWSQASVSGAQIGVDGAALLGGHSVDDPEPKYGMAVTGTVVYRLFGKSSLSAQLGRAASVASLLMGLFRFFQRDVAKLSGIKHFSALLALDELRVFLAGDDLDDGMFALGGHGVGSVNGMDSARLESPCQQRSEHVLVIRICGQVMDKSVVELVAYTPFWTYTN